MSIVFDVPRQFPRYNVLALLKITAVAAFVLATLNLLGPQKSWILLIVCYSFAPAIAMLLMFVLKKHSTFFRYAVAGLTLLFFGAVMIALCGMYYGVEAMTAVLIGTLIEWPGQLAILVCLQLIARLPVGAAMIAGKPSHLEK